VSHSDSSQSSAAQPSPFAPPTLQQIAHQAVLSYLSSPAGLEAISAAVVKTTNHAIQETLGSYSEFGKQLKQSVAASFAIGPSIDIPSYSHAVLAVLRQQVEKFKDDAMRRIIAERMTEILEPAPETIKLSEVLEKYKEYVKGKNSGGCHCDGGESQFYLNIKQGSSDSFIYVTLNDEEPGKYGSAEVEFHIHIHDDWQLTESQKAAAAVDKLPRGVVYSLTFDGKKECEKSIFAGKVYGFQKVLFDMMVSKTLVVVDVDDADEFDTSYSRE
jgi:hypothetical protein